MALWIRLLSSVPPIALVLLAIMLIALLGWLIALVKQRLSARHRKTKGWHRLEERVREVQSDRE